MTDWKYKEGNYIHPQDAEADSAEWKDFDSKDMHWYGPDRHYWFKAVYKVPQEFLIKCTGIPPYTISLYDKLT